MEAKSDFCDPVKPEFLFLASTDENDYLDDNNLIAVNEIRASALSKLDKDGEVFLTSITGKRHIIEHTKLLSMRKLTHWDRFFPINFSSVLQRLSHMLEEHLFVKQEYGMHNSSKMIALETLLVVFVSPGT